MNLNYSYRELAEVWDVEIPQATGQIHSVSIDTRSLTEGNGVLFFCLKGKRNGIDFVREAYEKGCCTFVVAGTDSIPALEGAVFFVVPDVLRALQKLAVFHRRQFDLPVIGITGSAGKTIVKEWLYHFLRETYKIVRSPKSYNSQIGVALSVLEIAQQHTLGIFEAGISTVGEMKSLEEMIQPTYGVFTALGQAHDDGFESRDQKFREKSRLFLNCSGVVSTDYHFSGEHLKNSNRNEVIVEESGNKTFLQVENYGTFYSGLSGRLELDNLIITLLTLREMNFPSDQVQEKLNSLPEIVMRMETVAGKNGNILINDSYNMDMDGLEYALVRQKEIAGDSKRVVVLGFGEVFRGDINAVRELVGRYSPDVLMLCSKQNREGLLSLEEAEQLLASITEATILFKGSHKSGLAPMINRLSLKHHQTYLEINRSALRNNLGYFKGLIRNGARLMVMVKASSYGSGSREMADFLENEGVDYLGVAFADEGVELRKAGVELPIMVMNTHPAAFDDIIRYRLEPAVFSVKQLDEFTRTLILHEKSSYPVHIKLETGMNRLGFVEEELEEMITYCKSQPEIRMKSVYSHLAESDNPDRSFTQKQIERFVRNANRIQSALNYKVERHICNTSGIVNYPEAHFDMVRLGIGLFGVGKSTELQPAISLKTHISKINRLQPGETLGYNREHVATKEQEVAVLPIGYADGIHRIFGNGKASVWLQGNLAPIIGNVCMDMCFVDVTGMKAAINDEVELFGTHHSINNWATWAGTIPYEILTSLSTRVKRVWLD